MTTTDLKPGDIVQHPTRLLNGLVVHGDGESIRILHLTSLGVVTTTSNLTGWVARATTREGLDVREEEVDHAQTGPRAKIVPPKTCLQCGSEFNKPPNLSSYNWGRREFCSVACSNISRKAAR